ncbi:MAG: hypothetical protein ACI91O_001402 [Candidatus Poriferisodalaceae bacterium]|jgi:uncharacterized protein (DUF427 family)
MTRAIFDGVVLAESDDIHVVDGLSYFPTATVNTEHLVPIDATTRCGWKGLATYFDVKGNSDTSSGAAFTYLDPLEGAVDKVADRIAFWKGVEITS